MALKRSRQSHRRKYLAKRNQFLFAAGERRVIQRDGWVGDKKELVCAPRFSVIKASSSKWLRKYMVSLFTLILKNSHQIGP